jgi:hypothetical protein
MQYLSARARDISLKTFAGIGFLTVLGAGLWVAAFTLSNFPALISRVGGAAVYLGSVFTPRTEGPTELVVEPTEETTPAEETEEETLPVSVPKVAGEKTEQSYAIGDSVPPVIQGTTGLPDLITNIGAIGFLSSTSTDSFTASSTVPAGMRPAVRFAITNQGTAVAASWRFSASIPTQSAYVFQSAPQQPLGPGDSIEYVLGFDQATAGADKLISITANSDSAFAETTRDNNSASAKITILGS